MSQQLPDEVSVNIAFSNVPLDSALLLLSTESNVNITFDSRTIPSDKLVSAPANHLKLGLVLGDILYNTGLDYRIVGNQLIIIPDPSIRTSDRVTITGTIEDELSGEPLEYASIYTDNGATGITSEKHGYYRLSLSKGDYIIHYSYLGYSKGTIGVRLRGDTTINMSLRTDNELNEIFVVEQLPRQTGSTEISDDLPVEMLNGTAALMGEADLFRMIHQRAGVTSGADGFGGLSIRGGTPDQNLVLMDGMPVYNTGHALGLFSVFNPSTVKSAKLIKAGFPARYGGRLSSVLDVRTKEGSNKEMKGDISVNPLLVRGTLEGPIKEGMSSFLVSGRRTIVDPWLKPLSKYQFELNDETGFVNFLFYDLNAKLNFQIGNRDEIHISGYAGKDRYDNEVATLLTGGAPVDVEEYNLDRWIWGNEVASAQWTHIFSRKLLTRATIGFSNYSFENFDFGRTVFQSDPSAPVSYGASLFASDIQDRVGTLELDYFAHPNYSLKMGASYTDHDILPGVSFASTKDDLLDDQNDVDVEVLKSNISRPALKGSEFRAYLEQHIRLGKRFTLNAGGHYSSIDTEGETYQSLQPRLSLQAGLSEKSTLRLSFSKMNQYMHLLSTHGLGLPNDVWIPSTGEIAPQESTEYSLGFETQAGSKTKLSISAYYKTFQHLRALGEGSLFAISSDVSWESSIPEGEGEALGFEFQMERRVGKWKGWINYTYSKSMRTFDGLNAGSMFYARNDRRHSINVNSLIQLNNNMEFSLGWTMATGHPFTVPSSVDPVPVGSSFELVPYYSGINNIRLPAYHKLDFSFNIYNSYNWGQQKISLGAYNAYNRSNPFYIDIIRDPSSGNAFQMQKVSILPIVPFVSLGLSF